MKQLSDYHRNPDNPRIIRDAGYRDLKKSLTTAPWMMKLRPLVADETGMLLAGDKRYQVLLELKYTEVPDEWVVLADDLTDDQKKEFIIKDNLHAGEWDWDVLANQWDAGATKDWGLFIPGWDPEEPTNALLATSQDSGMEGEPSGTTSAKRLGTGDEYAVFDQVLLVGEKKELLEKLNAVKQKHNMEKLSDALMLIIRNYSLKYEVSII